MSLPPIIDIAASDTPTTHAADAAPPTDATTTAPAPNTSEADALLDTLRRGLAADADTHARATAWEACHRVALLLQAPGRPPPPEPSGSALPAAVAGALELIRRVPPAQRLDVALTYLRSALPAGSVSTQPLQLQLVPVPRR